VAPASGDGQLLDLTTGVARALPGSRTTAAFSGDGKVVAWVDSRAAPRLLWSLVAQQAAVPVPLTHPGEALSDVALDATGADLAVVHHPAAGGAQLEVVALSAAGGAVVAQGPAAVTPVFTANGGGIAFVSGGNAVVAALPGGSGKPAATALPHGATGVLQAFVDAQVSGDTKALGALSVSGVNAAAATPHGLSRGYVVSAVANPDGTVGATARLVVDASGGKPSAAFADESLVLSPAPDGATLLVSRLTVTTLHDWPFGPHVVQVVPASQGGKLVLHVQFDSDLRESTVAGAVSVARQGGGVLFETTTYDVNTRTATVSVDTPDATPVTLTVATSLVDVAGESLATAFTVATGG
jgi:hypothetical protein